MDERPRRKSLPHDVPDWLTNDATFFITINCAVRGVNQLATHGISDVLRETMVARVTQSQWFPRVVLFMPDHLHALIRFPNNIVMKNVVRNWKRYTARAFGISWQRDFFDHRIRDAQGLSQKWEYVLDNPVRAGLVENRNLWAFRWFAKDFGWDDSAEQI